MGVWPWIAAEDTPRGLVWRRVCGFNLEVVRVLEYLWQDLP